MSFPASNVRINLKNSVNRVQNRFLAPNVVLKRQFGFFLLLGLPFQAMRVQPQLLPPVVEVVVVGTVQPVTNALYG
jgi:hypothetical protein